MKPGLPWADFATVFSERAVVNICLFFAAILTNQVDIFLSLQVAETYETEVI